MAMMAAWSILYCILYCTVLCCTVLYLDHLVVRCQDLRPVGPVHLVAVIPLESVNMHNIMKIIYNATVKLHLGVVAGGDHDPGRGAPLPDGEGDVGSGHRAGEHQHPHLYYILYCTVLYVLYCTAPPPAGTRPPPAPPSARSCGARRIRAPRRGWRGPGTPRPGGTAGPGSPATSPGGSITY